MLVSLAEAEAAALADVGNGTPFRSADGGGVDDTAGDCNVDAGTTAALRFLVGAEVAPVEAAGVASLVPAAGALLVIPLVACEEGVASEPPWEDDSAVVFFFAVDDISKSISWSSA